MTESIVVDFQPGHVAEVLRAFDTIESRAVKFEKTLGNVTRTESRARVTVAHREATERGRAIDKTAKLALQVERDQTKAAERAARESVRTTERAERDKSRAVERESRRRETEHRRGVASAMRMAKQLTDAELRERERGSRETARINQRYSQALRGGAGIGGRLVQGATGLAAGALALGGGFAIADVVQSSLGAEKRAIALSNSAYVASGGKGPRKDIGEILSHAKSIEATTNVKKEDLIEGWQDYVAKASDYEGGKSNLAFFAKMAKATGTDFKDVISTAGALKSQNENLSDSGMRAMMLAGIGQGGLGSVEFKDLAKHSAVITASSGNYALEQAEAQKQLMGLAQLAVKTAGDPAEAATAVKHFGDDIVMHDKKKARTQAGLASLLDKNEKLSSIDETAEKLFFNTRGLKSQAQAYGLGERSMKIFDALRPVYEEAVAAGKTANPKASEEQLARVGAKAVREKVSAVTGASYSEKDLDEDMRRVMSGKGEQFEAAMNKLKEVVADKLAPHLERFANKLPDLLPKIEQFVEMVAKAGEWLAKNPFEGIGLMMGANIAKEIAGAGLGRILESNIGSKAAAVGGAIAAVVAAFYVGKAIIDAYFENLEKERRKLFKLDIEDRNKHNLAVAMAQPGSAEHARALADKRNMLEGKLEQARRRHAALDEGQRAVSVQAGNKILGMLGRDTKGEYQAARGRIDQEISTLEDNIRAIDKEAAQVQARASDQNTNATTENTTAMQEMTAAIKASGGMSNPNDPTRNGPPGG